MKVLAFPGPKHDPSPAWVEEVAPAAPRAELDGGGPTHYDRITVRVITIAIVLSLLVHLAVLFVPFLKPDDQQKKAPADETGPLSVTIASAKPQPPAPVPKPDAAVPQPPVQPTLQPKQQARPKPTPQRQRPQIAVNRGSTPPFVVPPPTVAQPPTPQAPPTPQPVVPTTDDFSERLAARQAQRRAENGGAPDEVVESENERANRIAKANIAAQQRSASPGQDPDQAGGIFDLKHTGVNEAEFVFNGWNRTFRRSVGQTFEVRTGNNPDIRIAVIRQMIAVIREQRPGEFEWYSHRLGKAVTMSARPADQKELEVFLLKEFYADDPRAQARQ